MRNVKSPLWILPVLLSLAAAPYVRAQDQTPSPISNTMPTADFGFNLPTRLGTLTYSLSASGYAQTGYGNGGVYAGAAGSGNLAYLSTSERDPFSLVYSGGFLYSGTPGYANTSTYQDLAFSQVFKTRKWVFVISDALSYLPDSPTTGLSGVAGVGDIGVYPVQTGVAPTESILTYYGRRVGNGLSGSASYQMTASTDLNASGSWEVLRFIGNSNPGLDSNQYSGSAGIDHRIDALNSISLDANYNRQNYPGYPGAVIQSDGLSVSYTRTWSRAITTSVAIGPERSYGEGFGSFASVGIGNFPPELNVSGSATVNYAGRRLGAYAAYSRGVNAGSGVVFGALTDTVTIGASRTLSPNWNLGVNASYSHNVSLAEFDGVQPRTETVFGGIQVSRRLTETLSCYGSYTAADQSLTEAPGAANAFSGLSNTFAAGITFSPAPLHRGR